MMGSYNGRHKERKRDYKAYYYFISPVLVRIIMDKVISDY